MLVPLGTGQDEVLVPRTENTEAIFVLMTTREAFNTNNYQEADGQQYNRATRDHRDRMNNTEQTTKMSCRYY